MANEDEIYKIGLDQLPPLDPGMSRARFQEMLDDVRRLHHRWGDDLEHIISHVGMVIRQAEIRLARSRKAREGAPNLWTPRNLHDLWHAVKSWCRVLNCTVEEACAHLAKRGYLVGVTDYSGPVERSFEKIIRSGQALRAAFYKAERLRKSLEAKPRRNTEGENPALGTKSSERNVKRRRYPARDAK
jgi:hypothetical protein